MRKGKQNKRLNDKKVGFTNGNHMKYVEKKKYYELDIIGMFI